MLEQAHQGDDKTVSRRASWGRAHGRSVGRLSAMRVRSAASRWLAGTLVDRTAIYRRSAGAACGTGPGSRLCWRQRRQTTARRPLRAAGAAWPALRTWGADAERRGDDRRRSGRLMPRCFAPGRAGAPAWSRFGTAFRRLNLVQALYGAWRPPASTPSRRPRRCGGEIGTPAPGGSVSIVLDFSDRRGFFAQRHVWGSTGRLSFLYDYPWRQPPSDGTALRRRVKPTVTRLNAACPRRAGCTGYGALAS